MGDRKGKRGKVLMVQGTASHVGKSILVTALCRIFREDGFTVSPFKAQNMSNNAYVTSEGGEIGRAQAVQAEAAGVEPRVEMNPILLKPEVEGRLQVVLLGRPICSPEAGRSFRLKSRLWPAVARSLDTLRAEYDIVVIEGAGSPAEINVKRNEIANMRVALYAGAPVLLVGDIDRGGVFASLVGTLELLTPKERACIKGFVINKFRGDIGLLKPGLRFLEGRTGIPVVGVIPYLTDIPIPEEDAVALEEPYRDEGEAALEIAVVKFPRIANFDDFDPLAREKGVRVRFVDSPKTLGFPDLILLPGTKTTMADLEWLRTKGLEAALLALHRKGTPVIGICGGYQMLGLRILDPHRIESSREEVRGLGLLPVTTVFQQPKETHRVKGEVLNAPGLLEEAGGLPLEGYQIHMGRTSGGGAVSPFRLLERSGRPWDGEEGAIDVAGRVMGTSIHGLFHNRGVRRAMLRKLARWKGVSLPSDSHEPTGDELYERLAALVRRSLRMELIYRMVGLQ